MKGYFFLFVSLLIIVSCHPRCPIPSCHARQVHSHGGKTFRGNPWYLKQNPGIGENDNPLIRTKKYHEPVKEDKSKRDQR